MNPWLVIALVVIVMVAALMAFALLLTAVIVKIARRHAEKTVAKFARKMEAMLPGTNCGKCGYDSCYAYAEALIRSGADANRCEEGREGLEEELVNCVMEFRKLAEPPQHEEEESSRWKTPANR